MMLSRLRKIEDLTIKIAEDMPIHYDYEADTLYKKGRDVEAAKKDYTFVRNLLLNTGRHEQFSDEEIALLVGVTVEFVQKVKSDLAKEKP